MISREFSARTGKMIKWVGREEKNSEERSGLVGCGMSGLGPCFSWRGLSQRSAAGNGMHKKPRPDAPGIAPHTVRGSGHHGGKRRGG